MEHRNQVVVGEGSEVQEKKFLTWLHTNENQLKKGKNERGENC